MPRVTAWRILRAGRGLRAVAGAAARAGMDQRQRALVRRLVGTEVRRRATLRALLSAFARGRPGPDLAAHLRLGLVQLFFLDGIPDHAALSETVGAVHRTLGPTKARYANAVLRAALGARRAGRADDPRRDLVGRELHLAEPVFRDPAQHPLLWAEDALSMPAALLKRWSARYGDERALELARAALEEPPLSVRVVRGGRGEVAAELAALEPRPAGHASILLLDAARTQALLHTPAFREGRVSVQGETALRAAELCAPAPGERWLELAAAPGGKTAVLAGLGADVVAADLSRRRLARLVETLQRLGLAGRVRTLACDGAAALGPALFDGALVDAPCSNTGVLAQRPEARWRYGPASQRSLCALQARLLAEAAAHVRPGGRLVYATCSLEPEENARLVQGFVTAQRGWRLDAEIFALPEPGLGPTDGGYAARLEQR